MATATRLRVLRGIASSATFYRFFKHGALGNQYWRKTRFPQSRASSSHAVISSIKEIYDRVEKDHREGRRRSSLRPSLLRDLTVEVCENYSKLPPLQRARVIDQSSVKTCHRQQILRYLAVDTEPQDSSILHAITSYTDSSEEPGCLTDSKYRRRIQLQEACTHGYEGIIRCLLQYNATEAIKFLMELRSDIRLLLPSLVANDSSDGDCPETELRVQLQQFDFFLQDLLGTWFSSSMLQVRRVQYHTTAASIMETIAKYEAVHPLKSLDDLRQRLGPDRRVYALFHTLLPEVPLVVLHTSLQREVPTSMHQINSDGATRDDARVATFYSISNLQAGLAGCGLAEYLIKNVVDRLQSRIGLETFVTLSPVPKFRKWLESVAAGECQMKIEEVVREDDLQRLVEGFGDDTSSSIRKMVALLQENGHSSIETHGGVFRPVLSQLAAHYLVHVKQYSVRPIDSVARFHLGNGASLDQIHAFADTSRKAWHNSFGVMVNYHYDLSKVAERQREYEASYAVPIGRKVSELLPTTTR